MEDRWSKAVATAKYNGLRHWKTTNGERSIVVATGVVTFGSVTALSCYTQLLLGISTGAPTPLTTIAGVVTVCAASLASHTVAVLCTQRPEQRFSRKNSYLSTLLPSWNRGRSSSSHRSLLRPSQSQQCRVAAPTVATAALDDGWSLGPLYIPMHTLRMYVTVVVRSSVVCVFMCRRVFIAAMIITTTRNGVRLNSLCLKLLI